MKKIHFILFAAAMLIVGCSKCDVYEYHVADADWIPYNECHYAKITIPQLTQDVVDNGIVQVSRFYEQDGTVYYVPLPSIVTDINDDGSLVTTLVDNDYTVGEIYVYVTCSDTSFHDSPGDYSFRVAITR